MRFSCGSDCSVEIIFRVNPTRALRIEPLNITTINPASTLPRLSLVNTAHFKQVGPWGRRLRLAFDCYLQGDMLAALALYAQVMRNCVKDPLALYAQVMSNYVKDT